MISELIILKPHRDELPSIISRFTCPSTPEMV